MNNDKLRLKNTKKIKDLRPRNTKLSCLVSLLLRLTQQLRNGKL